MVNSRGTSFIELVITMVVLSVLSGFTFAFMHQCIKLYVLWGREAKLQMEAAVIMDRMTRELRESMHVDRPDATNVDPADGQYRTRYISFETVSGTPADPLPNGRYIQYCICKPLGLNMRRDMFRLNPASSSDTDHCCNGAGCMGSGECPLAEASAKRMSRSVYSRSGDVNTDQGFFVEYMRGDPARIEDDRYQLTLRLSDPANYSSPELVSVLFRTTICPRNFGFSAGQAYKDRSFNGNYSIVQSS